MSVQVSMARDPIRQRGYLSRRASSEIVTARQTKNRCDALEAKFRQINKEQSEQIGLVGWLLCYYFLPMALTIFPSAEEKMPLSSLLQDSFPLMTEFRNRNYLQGEIVAVLQYHPTGMRFDKILSMKCFFVALDCSLRSRQEFFVQLQRHLLNDLCCIKKLTSLLLAIYVRFFSQEK